MIMSTTLIRKAMNAVASLDYDQRILELREICLTKGVSEETFDRIMQMKVPTIDTLVRMREEGNLPPRRNK